MPYGSEVLRHRSSVRNSRFALALIAACLLAAPSAIAHEPPAHMPGCPGRSVAASAVQTLSDVQAFVECAEAYLAEHGPEEALRAFNEDERWKHGQIYVFVVEIQPSGETARRFIFPPNPAVQGKPRGASLDDFGTDLYAEIYRIMEHADTGWTYYSNPHPVTGNRSPKASYIIRVDWMGNPAVIGAGLYRADIPGTCHADGVSAAHLTADPSPERLRDFVNCAAMVVETGGYAAKDEIESDSRWSDGSNYVFVLDMMGNQLMTGSPLRVNGKSPHEWAGRNSYTDQFGGRDMVAVGDTFAETYLYYRSYNPMTWGYETKTGFVKRVVAHGVPLLVGAGYHGGPDGSDHHESVSRCEENDTAASQVRTRGEVEAFVRCAAEYVAEHGEEEARRAFNEDDRWKSGPTYVFASSIADSGEGVRSHVYPPDPSRQGSLWGSLIDGFGNDYFHEVYRIMSLADEGWIYYAFNNPATGRPEPKTSYLIEIEWDGEPAYIGAGIYEPDLPGSCDPETVNAEALEDHPNHQRLRHFVNCAAMAVESSGYFAGPVLSSDPRWNHGSIYVFGINADTGFVEFSGNPGSFAFSGMIPELLFGGRDVIQAGALFGEMYWYYTFTDPATGQVVPRVSFVRLVRAQGVPLLVAAGYNP